MKLFKLSLITEFVSTSRSKYEPPWRSKPSTICFFGKKFGKLFNVSDLKKFGMEKINPNMPNNITINVCHFLNCTITIDYYEFEESVELITSVIVGFEIKIFTPFVISTST